MKKIFTSFLIIIISTFIITSIVSAATTISTNIDTGGTLTVTGTSTMATTTFSGNVGIGAITPAAKLDIKGIAGSSDIFAISSSTNSRLLTVTAAGNVGIGTTSPASQLNIVSAASTDSSIIVDTTTAGTDSFLSLQSVGVLKWKIRNQSNNGDTLRIGQASNFRVFSIDQNGLVGINTLTPTNQLDINVSVSGSPTTAKVSAFSTLNINNTATSTTNSINKTGIQISSTGSWIGTNANNIGLYVSSVTGGTNNYDAIFNGGGNVGIGTTTPATQLHVTNSASNATTTLTVGKVGQNKGTCHEEFRSDGAVIYWWWTPAGAMATSSSSCK